MGAGKGLFVPQLCGAPKHYTGVSATVSVLKIMHNGGDAVLESASDATAKNSEQGAARPCARCSGEASGAGRRLHQ